MWTPLLLLLLVPLAAEGIICYWVTCNEELAEPTRPAGGPCLRVVFGTTLKAATTGISGSYPFFQFVENMNITLLDSNSHITLHTVESGGRPAMQRVGNPSTQPTIDTYLTNGRTTLDFFNPIFVGTPRLRLDYKRPPILEPLRGEEEFAFNNGALVPDFSCTPTNGVAPNSLAPTIQLSFTGQLVVPSTPSMLLNESGRYESACTGVSYPSGSDPQYGSGAGYYCYALVLEEAAQDCAGAVPLRDASHWSGSSYQLCTNNLGNSISGAYTDTSGQVLFCSGDSVRGNQFTDFMPISSICSQATGSVFIPLYGYNNVHFTGFSYSTPFAMSHRNGLSTVRSSGTLLLGAWVNNTYFISPFMSSPPNTTSSSGILLDLGHPYLKAILRAPSINFNTGRNESATILTKAGTMVPLTGLIAADGRDGYYFTGVRRVTNAMYKRFVYAYGSWRLAARVYSTSTGNPIIFPPETVVNRFSQPSRYEEHVWVDSSQTNMDLAKRKDVIAYMSGSRPRIEFTLDFEFSTPCAIRSVILSTLGDLLNVTFWVGGGLTLPEELVPSLVNASLFSVSCSTSSTLSLLTVGSSDIVFTVTPPCTDEAPTLTIEQGAFYTSLRNGTTATAFAIDTIAAGTCNNITVNVTSTIIINNTVECPANVTEYQYPDNCTICDDNNNTETTVIVEEDPSTYSDLSITWKGVIYTGFVVSAIGILYLTYRICMYLV